MIIIICWIALIAVHAMPALALFNPPLLTKMYGVEAGSNLFILFQHRAALFLVVCLLCAWAIFRPETRQVSAVSVGVSMISFLILFWMHGSPSALRSIAIADLAGLPFLAVAGWNAFHAN